MSGQKPKKHRESFFNLHFTSTISISLVLFVIGLIVSLYLTTHYFTIKSKENISLSIILNDTINETDLLRLERYLDATKYTKEVVYISRDSALKEHIAAIGEDPSEFLGYNPLSASLEVFLTSEYASSDSINNVIIPKLQIFNGIEDVTYQKDMIEMLNNNVNKLSLVLSVIALVMLFISIVLINNTIRLSIYSKRFIINTMRLVGATPWVIKKPFVKRNVLMGLQASIIALVAIFVTIYACYYRLGIMLIPITLENILIVTSAILSIGVLLTFLTSLFATGKYVRMKVDKMYEI